MISDPVWVFPEPGGPWTHTSESESPSTIRTAYWPLAAGYLPNG